MSEVAKVLPINNNTIIPSCMQKGGGSSGGSSANSRLAINSAIIKRKMEALNEEYRDAFGRQMPRAIYKEVRFDVWYANADWRYYLYSIREAAAAPRPSWAYAKAVFRRLMDEKPYPGDLCHDALDDGTIIDLLSALDKE